MLIDKYFGPYFPKQNWYPMPGYLLRRRLVKALIENCPRGKILDIGCGLAPLLHELQRMDFVCTGFDISKETIEIARSCLVEDKNTIKLFDHPQAEWENEFDYIFAFEVLEHILEDDLALISWLKWLKPGGTVFLSVPNHAHKWHTVDIVAGHVRRYDLKDMQALCEKAGLSVELITSYGFPLNNIATYVRNWIYNISRLADKLQHKAHEDLIRQREINNLKSARLTNYPNIFQFLRSNLGLGILKIFFLLQDLTQSYNLGNGILVKATKK
jgi:SAM-dependent methyltransferase